MRQTLCAFLIQAIGLLPTVAWANERPTLLRDAIAKEGAKLARDSNANVAQSNPGEWSAVIRIRPATPILVTSFRGRMHGRFIAADQNRLIILDASHSTLSEEASRALVALARNQPDVFVQALTRGTRTLDGDLRISPDDIFFKDRRVAAFTDLVQAIEKDSVDEITAPHRRLSMGGAVGGAVAGFLLSVPISVGLAFKQCGGSCADERILIAASFVGLPIAGGVLGARMFAKPSSGVIYRR